MAGSPGRIPEFPRKHPPGAKPPAAIRTKLADLRRVSKASGADSRPRRFGDIGESPRRCHDEVVTKRCQPTPGPGGSTDIHTAMSSALRSDRPADSLTLDWRSCSFWRIPGSRSAHHMTSQNWECGGFRIFATRPRSKIGMSLSLLACSSFPAVTARPALRGSGLLVVKEYPQLPCRAAWPEHCAVAFGLNVPDVKAARHGLQQAAHLQLCAAAFAADRTCLSCSH